MSCFFNNSTHIKRNCTRNISDLIFAKRHDRFTTVPFKPLNLSPNNDDEVDILAEDLEPGD